jgi:hypothetical protein
MFLAAVFLSASVACSLKPLTKEEATKKIVSDLFDNCKAGKNEAVATQFWNILPQREKERMKKDKFDYSDAKDKKEIDQMCEQWNNKYGSGYEFGKFQTQGEVLAWEVFPKGANAGQIYAFKPVGDKGDKYELVDIDPAKR